MEKQVTMGMQEYQELLVFKEGVEKKQPIIITDLFISHATGTGYKTHKVYTESEIIKELSEKINTLSGVIEKQNQELVTMKIKKEYEPKKWWQL